MLARMLGMVDLRGIHRRVASKSLVFGAAEKLRHSLGSVLPKIVGREKDR